MIDDRHPLYLLALAQLSFPARPTAPAGEVRAEDRSQHEREHSAERPRPERLVAV